MEITREFAQFVNNLVSQKQEELLREQSQRGQAISKEWASAGWDLPTGQEIFELNELQVESIRHSGGIVWSSLEKTLDAFDPPFYPDLAAHLYSLAESFFPSSLCETYRNLRHMGEGDPLYDDMAEEQLRRELEDARDSSLRMVKTKIDLYVAKKRSMYMSQATTPVGRSVQKQYDVFICHASEDKDEFVRPLANALEGKNIDIWYDEISIEWGKSIRQSIDYGLRTCKFGIVVFSHAFFQKKWPQDELDALYLRMMAGEARILPIWHKITESDIRDYAPTFSCRLARNSDCGVEAISDEIEQIVRKQKDE